MKPIFSHELNWKGTIFIEEFYPSDNLSQVSPITQVQAVTFTDMGHISLFQHIDGYFSFPGGKVEKGESLEKALKRECAEEMQAEIIKYKPIGYFKNWPKDNPENITYNARYVALVKLLNKPIDDPCKKAIDRKTVTVSEAVNTLGWGKKAEILVDTAKNNYKYL